MTCPSCNTKNTFTVTNNMGSIVWNCYKASCSVSGGTRTTLTADDIRKSLGFVAEETHVATFVTTRMVCERLHKDSKFLRPVGA